MNIIGLNSLMNVLYIYVIVQKKVMLRKEKYVLQIKVQNRAKDIQLSHQCHNLVFLDIKFSKDQQHLKIIQGLFQNLFNIMK